MNDRRLSRRPLRVQLPQILSPKVTCSLVDASEIPVFITNRDRLTSVKSLVEWLLSAGTRRVVIVDNASTYSPLLDYYKALPMGVSVHLLGRNLGPWAFWQEGMHKSQSTPYVVTDSDLVPDKNCPKDLIQKLNTLLHIRPESGKVGPGLKISDVPDVIGSGCDKSVEASYWLNRYSAEAFLAPIDTTFALYAAYSDGQIGHTFDNPNNLRMDIPYLVCHRPWYETIPLSSEEEYYREHSNKSWSHCSSMELPVAESPKITTGKVSVILTSYNRPGLIREAISSVLSQTYTNYELIVVDDGSNQETIDSVKSFVDSRIVPLFLGRRELSGARYCHSINSALEVSTGDFITHLADDDLYLPSRLDRMVKVFMEQPQVWITYGQQSVQSFDAVMQKTKEEIRPLVGITRKPQGAVDQHSFMYRRACLNYFSKPYWPTGDWWAGDIAFFNRLVRYWDFYPISEVLDVHRFHPNGIQSRIMAGKNPVYEAEV